MTLTEDDLNIFEKIIEKRIGLEMEDIKKMIRHLHNHIENIKNRQDRTDNRICNLGNVLENAFESALDFNFDQRLVDKVLNPDIDWDSEDDYYSPVDDVDRINWENFLKKKKE